MANEATSFKAGLEGVVANTSEVSFIDGQEGRLIYHGYDIHDLVNGGASFEEVIYLLWHGKLPNLAQSDEFTKSIATQRALQPHVLQFLREVPKNANAMEVLRTAVSFLGLYDQDEGDESREANIRKATRLVAKIPTIVTTFERIRKGLEPVQPDETLGMAASFFYLLRGEKPTAFEEKAFNTALILHADHELNASTFAARVTAGTLSDMYSAITSAIGALKGPLHGGANERVMEMLLEIGDMSKVESWLDNALAEKKKIMGFGHRVYRTEDPRATHLRVLSKEAGELAGETKWNEMSRTIERLVMEKKGLNPNVDFYSGSMYYSMGIPTHLFTPIFASSRVAGWAAHVLEQQANNRIIRPRAEYVGPKNLTYVPVNER
jgi:citrate synthase